MTLGVLLALGSACVWGTGDFFGGRASSRLDANQVLVLSALSGLVLLAAMILVTGEPLRGDASMAWAAAAGVCTTLGVVSLYRGLSVGSAATVAPLAAVTAAVLPVIVGALTQGMPRPTQFGGFIAALVGIFLVARSATDEPASREGMRLGLLAGVGFGGFLVLIARAGVHAVYVPLLVARLVMFAAAVALVLRGGAPLPRLAASPIALVAGVCDAGGTVFYLLAGHYVRLDVAAVLSSLYPAATVMLSRVVVHEPVTRAQWIGAAICVAAVALIAA
jgi:drug/metabolite transporter (DMT)-like permease